MTTGAFMRSVQQADHRSCCSGAWVESGMVARWNKNCPGGSYNDIYTINSDGTGLTPLTVGINSGYDNFVRSPSWSPNGAKLAVEFRGSNNNSVPHVSVMNSDGSGLTLLRSGGGKTSWSADGTIIVYTSLSGSMNNVSWVAADGSAGGTIVTNGWNADWQR